MADSPDASGQAAGAGSAPAVDAAPAIQVCGAEKVYGATVALAGADLVTYPGQIHALLGENGAGKSTLVRLLAGIEQADAGEIRLFGNPIEGPADVAAAEAAFIHQDLALFPTESVATNIALAAGFQRRLGLIDDEATIAHAQSILDRLRLRIDPRAPVGELPLAAQTVVAIARALSGGVRLIVLDEPTAYLEAHQVRVVLRLLGRLREEGVACLLITHRAGDVLSTCDRITVLRDGKTVVDREASGLAESDLVEMISGHAPVAHRSRLRASGKRGEDALTLVEAQGAGFGPLSLNVARGEVVAVCGLADAGSFEVGKAIFGLMDLDAGEIRLNGEKVAFGCPAEAIQGGVAYVPSERRAAGVAETLSARDNIFMRTKERWFAPVRSRDERRLATGLMERLGVYPARPEHIVSSFSGGNQQKIVLAKWLNQGPSLLVLNDPTAGVDLGAKAEIHARVAEMCEEGSLGVLLITSDFSEAVDFADRVYVMRRKQIVAELGSEGATSQQLVSLSYGGDSI